MDGVGGRWEGKGGSGHTMTTELEGKLYKNVSTCIIHEAAVMRHDLMANIVL